MRKSVISAALWAAALCLDAASQRGMAQSAGDSMTVSIDSEAKVNDVGDADMQFELAFSEETYRAFKQFFSVPKLVQQNGESKYEFQTPKIAAVARYLGLTSGSQVVRQIEGEFDDSARKVALRCKALCRAQFRGGRWALSLANVAGAPVEALQVTIEGESAVAQFKQQAMGMTYLVKLTIRLPKNVSDVRYDEATRNLTYVADPKVTQSSTTTDHPEFRLEARPRLISALYKQYGNPSWSEFWAARSVLANTTGEEIRNLRVRFRIDGYASWSPWERTEKVFPGQSIVNVFYPVINDRIIHLKGRSPAILESEFEYETANGRKVANEESARFEFLGMNEAVWSSYELEEDSSWFDVFRNAPMTIGAYVTANDPVIQDVVGVVSKATEGAGASLSDEGALQFTGTLYNLLRANISYETTPGGKQNGLLHQHLKFGRDVLRTRSGTCVNLAILCASVAEAAGLEAGVVLIPGHAFLKVVLPKSRQTVYVETTCCGGGTLKTSCDFIEAQVTGLLTYYSAQASGKVIEIDLPALREKGVTPPELPDAGPNPLQTWGIVAPPKPETVCVPTLLATVRSATSSLKLTSHFVPGQTQLLIDCRPKQAGKSGWITAITTFESQKVVEFRSLLPGRVASSQRSVIGERIAALNNKMVLARYDLSDAGDIALVSVLDVRESTLTSQAVVNALDLHFQTMLNEVGALQVSGSTTDEGGAAATARDIKLPIQPMKPAADVPPRHSIIGVWTVRYATDDGHRRSMTIRYNPTGEFRFNLVCYTTGHKESGSGKFSFDGESLHTTSGSEVVRARVLWVSTDEFVLNVAGQSFTYHRYPE